MARGNCVTTPRDTHSFEVCPADGGDVFRVVRKEVRALTKTDCVTSACGWVPNDLSPNDK
jgi:hypothetical protein